MDHHLLQGIHHAPEAGYCYGNREGCLRGTRGGILQQLEHWLEDEQSQRVFWLNGLAGTGKSTIAQTFAEIMFAEGKLGASFFCSREFEDRSNIQTIFPTLALQLAYQYPLFREQLLRVLRADPGIGRQSLCSQLEDTIVGPLRATHISTLIIIDALDECKDQEPASAILSVLSRYVDEIPEVKFFITGRPEPRIRSGFRLELLRPITEVLKLHEVKPEVVDRDIKLFFQTQLASLAKHRSDCDFMVDWPTPSDIKILCKKAAGFFIYASTVIKFVASEYDPLAERLSLITSLPGSTVGEGKSGVDQLYIKVLEQAFRNAHADSDQLYSRFRSVVGTVLLIFNPLSVNGLLELLKKSHPPSGIPSIMRPLHSVLLVPDNKEDPIRAFHKSFPDFLTDPERCKDKRFFINPSVHHQEILLSCLDLMAKRLRRNICGLDDHDSHDKFKHLPALRRTHIGDALEYACKFWARHLMEIPSNNHNIKEVHEAIDKFFTTQLLYWIEVLGLMGKLDVGPYAINDVGKWYTSVSCGLSTRWKLVFIFLFRQEIPVSGWMTASVSSWNTLMQSVTLLPRFTILHSHFPLPLLGFTSIILQSCHKRLM
jgi:hypothetical protein